MSDCLTKPRVQKVDLVITEVLREYIRISAWDKFRVETVSVMIMIRWVSLSRKPGCCQDVFWKPEWDYIATTENVDYTEVK